MKQFLIILATFTISCSTPEINKISEISILNSYKSDTNIIIKNNTIDVINDEYGKRNYIDSLNFHIIRRWFDNGNLFVEFISDRDTKTEYTKEFYKNGNLKHEGLMIENCTHDRIGIWKYYDEKGKLTRVTDYDKKQPISYSRALEIAKKKGFIMPEIEVETTYSNKQMYWQINRWKENQNGNGRIAETILINSKTGEVSKPDYQLIGIY